MTKEQILDFIDNCEDINSPEMKDFKNKVNSDPKLKDLVEELHCEHKSNIDIDITLFNGISLVIESQVRGTDNKFDCLTQYLSMPTILINKITDDQFDKISQLVNGFILTSNLSKEQNEKLVYLLDKLKNKSEKDLEK